MAMTEISIRHKKLLPTLDKRRAGVILHPTSLPGVHDQGDLGPDAYRFVDFMQECGLSIWQMLPVCPTHDDRSPYMGISVYAGNPELISLELLQQCHCGSHPRRSAARTLSARATRRDALYASAHIPGRRTQRGQQRGMVSSR